MSFTIIYEAFLESVSDKNLSQGMKAENKWQLPTKEDSRILSSCHQGQDFISG